MTAAAAAPKRSGVRRAMSRFLGSGRNALKQGAKAVLGQASYRRLRFIGFTLAAATRGKSARMAMAAHIALARGDLDKAERLWAALAEREPQSAAWRAWLCKAADMRTDYARAMHIANEAWDRGVRGAELEAAYLHYRRWYLRTNSAIDEAEAAIANPQTAPQVLFDAARYLCCEGRLDTARAGFLRLVGSQHYDRHAQYELKALDLLDREVAQGRSLIPAWFTHARDHVMVQRPGADTTVIVITQVGGRLGVSANVVQAILSRSNVNVIYLYDPDQAFSLTGCPSLGRGYEATLATLRDTVRAWGTRTLITMGISASAYAAIRYGLDLAADGVMCFSPRTDFSAEGELNGGFYPFLACLSQRGHALFPQWMKSLRPEVEARNVCPMIEIHYGAGNANDSWHARNLEGLPGVRLVAMDCDRHDCLTEYVARGEEDALAHFIDRVRNRASG
ncbi:MAG: hypothetical protein GC166_07775 [Alphaproteobacteria bacterium]|nr:hypothetical protein [Alphaproteobacteria bacterium]